MVVNVQAVLTSTSYCANSTARFTFNTIDDVITVHRVSDRDSTDFIFSPNIHDIPWYDMESEVGLTGFFIISLPTFAVPRIKIVCQ